eukprot:m.1319349 g.1319349  ORF g.1319349 m.1319349 type:complete len:1779 (+) comp24844_c0_seq1:205-5541(+)
MSEETPVIWLLQQVFKYVFLGINTLAEALWIFLRFVVLRIYDVIAFGFFVMSLCSIVRTYQSAASAYMIWRQRAIVSRGEVLGCVFFGWFCTIADIFLYAAFSLVFATGWRTRKVWKLWYHRQCDIDFGDLDEPAGYYRMSWRGDVWEQFYLWCLDLFVVPFGLIVVVTVYRVPSLLERMRKSKSDFSARGNVVAEFLHILVDIPCFLLGVAMCCTWRLPFMLSQCMDVVHNFPRERFDHNELRWIPIAQFGIFLYDIPAIVCLGFCVLPNVWILLGTGVSMCWKDHKKSTPNTTRFELFRAGGRRFWKNFNSILHSCAFVAVFDIFATMGSIVLLISWRHRCFRTKLSEESLPGFANAFDELYKRRGQWYSVTATELLNLALDIPVMVIALVVFGTVWRSWTLASHLRQLKWRVATNNEIRGVVIVQFCKLVRDVILVIPLSIVLVTLWRTRYVYKKMNKKIKGSTAEWQDALGTCWQLIVMNFVLLLVDAIAIPFAVVLLCSWRAPKLLSGWAASGNFYKFFAVTVFIEFGRFVVDIPLMLWFLLMLVLRPYGAVILLLEDSKHRRRRKLCALIPEVRSIVAHCKDNHAKLHDMVDMHLKDGRLPVGLSTAYLRFQPVLYGDGSRLCGKPDHFVPWPGMHEVVQTVGQLEAHRQRTHHLSRRYKYLLDQVLAIESKRARKEMRRAHAEFLYMCRPDPRCRAANMQLVQAESLVFDQQADRAYAELAAFEPPRVPLWTHSSGWSTRTRGQTIAVLLEIGTTGYFFEAVLLVVNMCLLYRMPIVALQLRTAWWKRREILLSNLLEHLLDLLALICILITTAGLYRVLELYGAIAVSLVEHRSWRRARQNAFDCVRTCIADVWDLLAIPFKWKTYTFLTLALLWGVLVPIDLYQPLTGTGGAVVLWIVFSGFPFLWNFYIVDHVEQDVEHFGGILLGYSMAFSLCLLLSLRALARKKAFEPAPNFRVLQYNWDNFNTVVAEVIDVLQISALVFYVGIPSIWDSGTKDFAHYMLLNFIPLDVKFWVFVSCFVVWYFIASAPPLLEDVMKSYFESALISNLVLWQLSAYFFTNTIFISMTSTVFDVLGCNYDGERVVNNADTSTQCWQGQHNSMAVFSLYALMWYASTTILYNARYSTRSLRQDIQFCALYLTVNNVIKLTMVAAVILFGKERPYFALGAMLVLNLFGLGIATFFEPVVGYPICNLPSAVLYKRAAYVATTWLSVVGIIAVSKGDSHSVLPVALWLGGWACVACVAVVLVRWNARPSPEESAREEVKAALLALEARLYADGHTLVRWEQRRKAWQRKVGAVRSPRWISRADYDALGESGVRGLLMAAPEELSLPPPSEHGRFGCCANYTPRRDNDGASMPAHRDDGASVPPYGAIVASAPPSAGFVHNTAPVNPPMYAAASATLPDPGPNPTTDTLDNTTKTSPRVSATLRTPPHEAIVPLESGVYPPDVPAPGIAVSPPSARIVAEMRSGSYDEAVNDTNEALPPYEETSARVPAGPEGVPPGARCPVATTSGFDMNDYPVFDGQSIVLELENNVRYNAMSLELLATIHAWRIAVQQASWEGMLKCVKVLENSVGLYTQPSQPMQLPASATDIFSDDADEIQLPPFVDYDDESEDTAVARSAVLKESVLKLVRDKYRRSEALVDVLDRMIPSNAIESFTAESDTRMLVDLRRDIRGTIHSVGACGIAAAQGAFLQWRDRVELVFEKYESGIVFRSGDLRVGKGVVGVSVRKLSASDSRFEAAVVTPAGTKSKSLPYLTILDTVSDIRWNT